MKRILALLISVTLILSLASCGSGGKTANNTSAPSGSTTPAGSAAPTGSTSPANSTTAGTDGFLQPAGDSLPVYISSVFDSTQAALAQQTYDYINGFLHDQGFNITLEPVDSSVDFNQFTRDHINDNAVFFPQALYDLTNDPDFVAQLGDFYNDAVSYVPGYMEQPRVISMNDPGTLIFMPTQFDRINPNIASVLVREDVAEEYGKDINTASDYINLLQWLKTKDPYSVPGMTFPIEFGMSNTDMFYDFYMPELGYWSSDGWTSTVSNIGPNDVSPMYSTPECCSSLKNFIGLARDGLLYMNSGSEKQDVKLSDYPTLLMYLYDFISPNAGFAVSSGLSDFDASDYRVYALYNGEVPAVVQQNAYWSYSGDTAIAGKNANISEFLRFIDWLGQQENYDLLFYGKEGTDYTLQNGRMVFTPGTSVDWTSVRKCLYFLERSDFKPIPLTAPGNIESVLSSYRPAYTVTIPDGFDLLKEMVSASNYIEGDITGFFSGTYGNTMNLYKALFGNYYHSATSVSIIIPNEDLTTALIDAYLQKQAAYSPFFDVCAKVLSEQLAAAASQ